MEITHFTTKYVCVLQYFILYSIIIPDTYYFNTSEQIPVSLGPDLLQASYGHCAINTRFTLDHEVHEDIENCQSNACITVPSLLSPIVEPCHTPCLMEDSDENDTEPDKGLEITQNPMMFRTNIGITSTGHFEISL